MCDNETIYFTGDAIWKAPFFYGPLSDKLCPDCKSILTEVSVCQGSGNKYKNFKSTYIVYSEASCCICSLAEQAPRQKRSRSEAYNPREDDDCQKREDLLK